MTVCACVCLQEGEVEYVAEDEFEESEVSDMEVESPLSLLHPPHTAVWHRIWSEKERKSVKKKKRRKLNRGRHLASR